MEVMVLKAFMFKNKVAEAGSIVDMPVADAQYVIGLKRAEQIVDKPAEQASSIVLKVRKSK